MWALLELVFLAAIVLLSITEFFYPLIARKPLFGSFRKRQEQQSVVTEPEPLQEKISKAKEKVKEIKNVQQEVNNNFKSAEKLKEEADDLLNNTNN
jgi:hypothetical protein